MVKIMVVDDSETIRTQLRKDLEAAGYKVVDASDGIEGLTQLKDNSDVRLVISDVNMPRMDGIAMSAAIHGMEEFKALPILMMTTESSAEMKAKGKAAGVLAWIVKPYSSDKLLTALTKLIR